MANEEKLLQENDDLKQIIKEPIGSSKNNFFWRV